MTGVVIIKPTLKRRKCVAYSQLTRQDKVKKVSNANITYESCVIHDYY